MLDAESDPILSQFRRLPGRLRRLVLPLYQLSDRSSVLYTSTLLVLRRVSVLLLFGIGELTYCFN